MGVDVSVETLLAVLALGGGVCLRESRSANGSRYLLIGGAVEVLRVDIVVCGCMDVSVGWSGSRIVWSRGQLGKGVSSREVA